jgi:hypothetical protein
LSDNSGDILSFSIPRNSTTGKEFAFDDEEDRRSRLTRREIEILEKTGTENTAEALRYATGLGLI